MRIRAKRNCGLLISCVVLLAFVAASAAAQDQQQLSQATTSTPDGQQSLPTRPEPPSPQAPVTLPPTNSQESIPMHRFWDRENDLLFAAVGASRAFDYASTLNLRRRGLNEIFLTNAIVDNHPLFAGIEAAATGASMGVSYVFHRTGHHRLERWTSIVHFGIATGGAARNYALKQKH